MSRFVSFSTHRLELGQGKYGPEWLEIRDQLSHFEQQALNSAMLDVEYREGGDYSMKADLGKYQPAILKAYITGWQLFNEDARPVPFSLDVLARLDEETCRAAVEHISEYQRMREEAKKATSIEIVGTVISRS